MFCVTFVSGLRLGVFNDVFSDLAFVFGRPIGVMKADGVKVMFALVSCFVGWHFGREDAMGRDEMRCDEMG